MSNSLVVNVRETESAVDVQVYVNDKSWGFWSFPTRDKAAGFIKRMRKKVRR